MGKYQGVSLNRYKITILVGVVVWLLGAGVAMALPNQQPGVCIPDESPDGCFTPTIFITLVWPTPTPGPTHTPYPTPTGAYTPDPTATTTATPVVPPPGNGQADGSPFDRDYTDPTSIPRAEMPSTGRTDAGSRFGSVVQPTAINLLSISTTLNVSTEAMITDSIIVTDTSAVTGTLAYTLTNAVIGDNFSLVDAIIDYTNQISGYVSATEYTGTLAIETAPSWYAPNLPRDMANIGWTIEQLDSDTPQRLSMTTWATLLGNMAAMPIKLGRTIWEFFSVLGPFGLFLVWLFVVMLPAVLGFKIALFIKTMIIKLFNFTLWIVDWILKLWNAVPLKFS